MGIPASKAKRMIYVSSRSLRLTTSERGTVPSSRPSGFGNSPLVVSADSDLERASVRQGDHAGLRKLGSSGLLSQAPQESASVLMDWVRNGDKVYR